MVFFFQAEDGIRDKLVTGVQTCALPICPPSGRGAADRWRLAQPPGRDDQRCRLAARADPQRAALLELGVGARGAVGIVPRRAPGAAERSEERRVGKECRSWGSGEVECEM